MNFEAYAPDPMLHITNKVSIPLGEVELQAVRAQGPGGQHVNKSATAIHLRFDVRASSLPEAYKERLLALNDARITADGVVVIKAQRRRSQEKNRKDALHRLRELVRSVSSPPKKRKPTKPSKRAKQKRLDDKKRRGQIKALRRRID